MIEEKPTKDIRPQPGPQTEFLSTNVDIGFYGGAAGGGKSYALLLDPLRHMNINIGATIYRRTMPQITTTGGLWDESMKLYGPMGGVPKDYRHEWDIKHMKVKFSELQYDKDVFKYQGASQPLQSYDELPQFSEYQFFYMMARNRSVSGVKSYIRATLNPDPDSWVFKFVEPYIDEKTGYANPEMSGKVRYFVRVEDDLVWDSDRDRLKTKYGLPPISFTFISANLDDNKILTDADPDYKATLLALPKVERERLLKGNWHIRPGAGLYFRREWFRQITAPQASTRKVRFWDRAATEKKRGNDPDWTVGTLFSKTDAGRWQVENVVRFRDSPWRVEANIVRTATQDGQQVFIGLEQEPGASGKSEVQSLIKALYGYNAKAFLSTGDKVTRAGPVSAQSEAGNVDVVEGKWNEPWYKELENFPEGSKDDQIDSLSGAFNMISSVKIPRLRTL